MDEGQPLPHAPVLPRLEVGPVEERHHSRAGLAGDRCKEMSPSACTAPGLLAARAQAAPDEVAFRSKHLGLYRERTWKDYAALVARCARGFPERGLEPGE